MRGRDWNPISVEQQLQKSQRATEEHGVFVGHLQHVDAVVVDSFPTPSLETIGWLLSPDLVAHFRGTSKRTGLQLKTLEGAE